MTPASPSALGLTIGVVQFFFATTWTLYVIYLPQLAQQAGIGKQWVPWILVADQVIFAVADVATGFWIDRVRAGFARLGGWILGITVLSSIAFLALPYLNLSPLLLLGAIVVWAVTSSALRSPPWAMLSRHAAQPSMPWLAALVLTGGAAAAALAPYLGIALRGIDPRVPFVVSTLTLLATVAGLVYAERRLPAAPASPGERYEARPGTAFFFYASLLVMAAGFQIHFSLNSAPRYLALAPSIPLGYLMPVFWVGFSLAMPVAPALVKRLGELRSMAVAAGIGTAAIYCATLASTCAAASGLALVLISWRGTGWRGGRACLYALGGLIAGVGVLTLFEHVTSLNLGIDTMLGQWTWGQTAAASSMRMGPPASLSFTAVGTALVLLGIGGDGPRTIAGALGLASLAIAMLSLIGYLYGAENLYALPRYTGIALQSATMIAAIGIGIVLWVPEHGIAALLRRKDAGGVAARRLLLPLVLAVIGLGWLRVNGERANLYDSAFGSAGRTMMEIGLVVALLLWTASGLSAADRTQRVLGDIGVLAAKTGVPGGMKLDGLVQAACRRVADELRVARCGLSRVDLEAGRIVVDREAHSGADPLQGSFAIAEYAPHLAENAKAGRTTVVCDLAIDPRTAERYERLFRPIGVRAHLSVPLNRDGKWVANFWVSHDGPWDWTEAEVALTRTVAERIWLVVEQARVGTVLLESDERLRNALRDAERANHLKDEFLATLSHELRTPMTAILGWAQMLRQAEPGATVPQEEMTLGLEVIERNARVQSQIIEDLLDMSRIISGKVRLDIQAMDLATVLQSAVEVVRPSADAKDVRLQLLCPASVAEVRGDPARIQQVFFNLLSNAVKFTPKGGRVRVVCQRVNSHVEVAVSDSGIGIKAEFLPHVFERFRQQEAATTRMFGGLGLGLAIVKQLVELHGGSVHAASEGENQGATFTVHLPIAVALPAPPPGRAQNREHPRASPLMDAHQERAPVEISLAGMVVLVVDDEADARDLLRKMLEAHKAVVALAGSVREAIDALVESKPSVLLSDIGMPGEDGYALIRRVRELPVERGGGVPAIALTAFARTEDRTRAMQAGFDMHLAKPIDRAELMAGILAVTRKK